jgi:hypothetical protein
VTLTNHWFGHFKPGKRLDCVSLFIGHMKRVPNESFFYISYITHQIADLTCVTFEKIKIPRVEIIKKECVFFLLLQFLCLFQCWPTNAYLLYFIGFLCEMRRHTIARLYITTKTRHKYNSATMCMIHRIEYECSKVVASQCGRTF